MKGGDRASVMPHPGDGMRERVDRMELQERRQGHCLIDIACIGDALALRLLVTNIRVGRPEIGGFLATVTRTGRDVLAARS